MRASRDIDTLLNIMARLRDPQTGCAWDVEQSFATIAPYTIEEAYEVADAIERADMNDLVEELGDLLLQVVFHARMAQEAGHFEFGDVVWAITQKMIRRHPHVFGEESQRSRKLAKGEWDRIKAAEKREKELAQQERATHAPSLLDDVPRVLPALMRALKIQQKAATVGFDWKTAPPILEKIKEEIEELEQEMAAGRQDAISEEYGDLLFAVVNLGRHLDLNPEAALTDTNNKFRDRFRYIESVLAERGSSPREASLDEMEDIWQRAKSQASTDPT